MHNENKTVAAEAGTGEENQVDFDLTLGDTTHHIYFKSNLPQITLTPEARIAAALWPSMVSGHAYHEADPLDPKFLSSLNDIQTILKTWQPQLSALDMGSYRPVTHEPVQVKDRVASFFSGGLDSFYTLLKNQEEITDLIFVHGMDIQLTDEKLRREAMKTVERVAREFGKNVIQIETNIRSVTDHYIGWAMAHGAAMASMAHLFSSVLGKIYIPASHTYSRLTPWGSHPLLDPLWSTRSLEFIYDGAEATRLEKIAAVSRSQLACETLRVCWQNYDGAYNCCRCEKCQRTMINMRIVGVLDKFTTFPEKLDMGNIRALWIHNKNMEYFIRESRDAALEKGDTELASALTDLLKGQNIFQKAFNTLRRAISQPHRVMPALKRRLGRDQE